MIELKKLKKGDYLLYKGEQHVVKDIGIAVTGTHSHAKVKATVRSIFSNKTETFTVPMGETVEDLAIIRKEGQVISKVDNKIQVMDMRSFETFDAEADDDLLPQINEGNLVTFVDYNNRAKIIEKR